MINLNEIAFIDTDGFDYGSEIFGTKKKRSLARAKQYD